MSRHIDIYDVTLRDGAQGPRVKFSSEDQVRIVRELDDFGVQYIEGGWPASSSKASEIFVRTRDMHLKNAVMAAFGSTRHPKSTPEDDRNLKSLLDSHAPVLTIFAKTSPLHVREVLKVTLDENLQIIRDSIEYLHSQGRRVFLDAEHFFDAYDEDPSYALAALQAASESSAEALVLCDTNGGHMPWQIESITRLVKERFPAVDIGIHTHNDSGCAVANTLSAVQAGASHVQGTINGYGERTGNANLITILPDLQIKMGITVLSQEQLAKLTHLAHLVAELANLAPRDSDPYVGRDAFTHKGGMHADAVKKLKASYEHINPETVGNRTHIPVSEMSGRSSVLQKSIELGIPLDRDAPETKAVLDKVKELENEGYEFETADASLELLIRKAKGEFKRFFDIQGYRVTVETRKDQSPLAEATVKLVLPDGVVMHTVAEGNGPVDALDSALRKALLAAYPEVNDVHLEDYKVRILDGRAATAAKTRVLIEHSDKETSWDTVGVSENIIDASCRALLDGIEYKLYHSRFVNK